MNGRVPVHMFRPDEVWEMGAVAHESQAWIQFLRSKRDDTAVRTWLADQYKGPIWKGFRSLQEISLFLRRTA